VLCFHRLKVIFLRRASSAVARPLTSMANRGGEIED
jgi:hypothetical protein